MVQQQHQQEQQIQMEQQQQQAVQVAQQQQQQQSQQYMGDMTGGYYTPTGGEGTETAGQYYNGQDGKTDANTSLGVYTPDSATNSVHSMHGYPAHAGDVAEYHGDTSGEYSGHEAGEQFQHNTGPSESDPVHNTSVMESPSSIGSVEIPSVYDNCANSTTMAGHHRMNQNSPQQGITGHSPIHHQQPGITGQSPTALHNNLTKQSPIHHQQQQPIPSQSPHPHPIQSPHPQPSPHNQQSSPHPQILPSSPYTSLPHQSPTPQPSPHNQQ